MRVLRLDGMRAFAVLCVFLHHMGVFSEGWIGVDIFFVLSGYLITQILRRERSERHYWKRFYLKRATRILPSVLVLLTFTAVHEHHSTLSLLAYLLFAANFVGWTPLGIPTLGVMWSLAVEEHFYFVFPFAVRYMSRPSLIKLLLSVVLIEPLLRCVATHHVMSYSQIYTFTYFHLDGLAMGALLAIARESEETVAILNRWSGAAFLICVGLYVLMRIAAPGTFSREANTPLFNLLGYTLLALSSLWAVAFLIDHPHRLVSKLLELRPVVYVGTISYGIYLYHFACLYPTIHLVHGTSQKDWLLILLVTCAAASLSYELLEKRCVNMGKLWAGRLKNSSA